MNTLRRSTGRSRRRPRTRGQALVEFALVLPLFILLLAGMIDFGMGLYSYMSVINGARDAGRLAATDCSAVACTDPVRTRAVAATGLPSLTTGDVGVVCTAKVNNATVACAPNSAAPANPNGVLQGDTVTVTVSYSYHMIWPLGFGTQIPMSSTVQFLIE
jgi:Flp pilus assembly protein TadG